MAEPVQPNNNISGFVSAFAGGGVRTNLFKVTGTIPGAVDATGTSNAISFLCKSAQIPASSLGQIEIPYRGRKIKIPGDRTFADWSITIISDANLNLRSAFEFWSSQFNTHVSNVTTNAFMSLMVPWSVTQLLRDGTPLRTYEFQGCFPSEIGAIELGYENNDAIAEFPVTLQYSWWEAAPSVTALATGQAEIGAASGGTNIGTGFGP